MIRLLELPGVAEVENRCVLNDLTGTRLDHDLNRMIASVTQDIFGIDGSPEAYFEWAYDDEDDFDGEEISDIEHWRRAGWDISKASGEMMRSFSFFEAAMVCVTEGYAGKDVVELEALVWQRRKATSVESSPKIRAQNQNFLALGKVRRKPAA